MLKTRVIPCLLLCNQGLVKGIHYKNYSYIGDPLNAVKIFNDKEVPELFFVDISATDEKRTLSKDLIQTIADECYMPFTVGGGIRSVDDIRMMLFSGAEKVTINTAAVETPEIISEAANIFGSQSIMVSIDVKKKIFGKSEVFTHSGKKSTQLNPLDHAKRMEDLGAGELLVTSIDCEGTMQGYDLDLIRTISDAVSIPVIASGGAGSTNDFAAAIRKGHASAVAAGSMFVFHGRRRAVLINYPSKEELKEILS